MFFNSTYPKKEIDKERQVIKEEKKMYEDDPKSFFDNSIGNNFLQWSIGHETIGTDKTIESINRKKIIGYLERTISLENIVFVCCGDIDTKSLRKYIEKNLPKQHSYFKNTKKNEVSCGLWTDIITKPDKIKLVIEKEGITQSFVSMFTQGPSIADLLDFQNFIIAIRCLGGDSFSKLYIRLREELGLCYSCGMTNIPVDYPSKTITELYGYTSPQNVNRFIEESEKVLKKALKNGIDKDTFECARSTYLFGVLRSIETSENKAMALVKRLLSGGDDYTDEVIWNIKGAKINRVNEMLEKYLNVDWNWAIMIPKEAK
jgi:predicted Zn-dependent peptidase